MALELDEPGKFSPAEITIKIGNRVRGAAIHQGEPQSVRGFVENGGFAAVVVCHCMFFESSAPLRFNTMKWSTT
jgi:hypothetical protein